MSASSEAAPSVEENGLNLDALAGRIHKKLTFPLVDSLPVAAHKSAGSCMLRVRDSILRGNELSQPAKMSLLCAGCNCARRVVCEADDEGSIQLIKTTQTLLFSLLVLSEPKLSMDIDNDTMEEASSGEEGEDDQEDQQDDADREQRPAKRARLGVRDEEQLLLAWKAKSLADKISPHAPSDSSWSTMLKCDSAVSRAALKEAKFVSKSANMAAMYDLSCIFFRCSASAMASSMLATVQAKRPREPSSSSSAFLTLDVVSMMNDANEHQDEKLHALADAAESESGQAVRAAPKPHPNHAESHS